LRPGDAALRLGETIFRVLFHILLASRDRPRIDQVERSCRLEVVRAGAAEERRRAPTKRVAGRGPGSALRVSHGRR